MRIITATIYRTPMPEILGEALYELACLAQLFPAIRWPLRMCLVSLGRNSGYTLRPKLAAPPAHNCPGSAPVAAADCCAAELLVGEQL